MVNLWGVKYYESHFTDDETDVSNKSEVICPSSWVAELGIWTQFLWLQRGNFSKIHDERGYVLLFFFFFKGVMEAQRSIPAQAGMGLQRISGKQELVSWGAGRALPGSHPECAVLGG